MGDERHYMGGSLVFVLCVGIDTKSSFFSSSTSSFEGKLAPYFKGFNSERLKRSSLYGLSFTRLMKPSTTENTTAAFAKSLLLRIAFAFHFELVGSNTRN